MKTKTNTATYLRKLAQEAADIVHGSIDPMSFADTPPQDRIGFSQTLDAVKCAYKRGVRDGYAKQNK